MLINNGKSLIHYSQILLKSTLFIFEGTEPLNFKIINTPSLINTPTNHGADFLHHPSQQKMWSETEHLSEIWNPLLLFSYHVEKLFQAS